HVHDLVDFVTEESYNAGKNAADYVKGKRVEGETIELVAENGVGYTVPKTINVNNVDNTIDVRFRVRNVFSDSYISVYFDGEREVHRKKKVLAPGEMETVKLNKAMFEKYPNCKKITVKVEGE
ncbi:MAG: pyridine nucleotide-disulfide oxidoreductase, partial [Clostridiaceae bacterium]